MLFSQFIMNIIIHIKSSQFQAQPHLSCNDILSYNNIFVDVKGKRNLIFESIAPLMWHNDTWKSQYVFKSWWKSCGLIYYMRPHDFQTQIMSKLNCENSRQIIRKLYWQTHNWMFDIVGQNTIVSSKPGMTYVLKETWNCSTHRLEQC